MTSVPALQADMNLRTATDWQQNFWPVFFLSLITCGIYGIYVLYKMLDRRQQHFERMINLRQHLIGVLKEKAEAAGRSAELEQDLSQLEGIHMEATARDRAGEKSPALWLVLSIVVGIVVYYVYYFLNDDFRAHESNEQRFMARASEIMATLGMPDQPILMDTVVPERNFIVYILLTLVTCGIYGIYWMYTVLTDPNRHFQQHEVWEARLAAAVTV